MRRSLSIVLALAAAMPLSSAQDTAPAGADTKPALTREQVVLRARQLNEKLLRQFGEKDYAAAEATCREGVALLPQNDAFQYNLACALARQGKADAAMAALARSIELGYAEADHMAADADLETLRQDKRFAELKAKAAENAAKQALGTYEPGEKIAGVRTVEGNPEGGLRWRLHISPDASPEKPHRLIVWLHPSGGSMNRFVEPMAKAFAARGWALLVLTQKDWRGWSVAYGEKLMKVTLPEVAKVEGLDARRPVLLGYSAGGQIALRLYGEDPARFGGLVVDAAYPIARGADGKVTVTGPPEGKEVRDVPILVLVGDKDGGAKAWQTAEKPWREKGVPLEVIYVPDKGHTWLFGPEQFKRLHRWLDQVKAGERPGAKETDTQPATAPVKEG